MDKEEKKVDMIGLALSCCAGIAAERFIRQKMRMTYRCGGAITRTGVATLAVYGGITAASIIFRQYEKLKDEFSKKEEEIDG